MTGWFILVAYLAAVNPPRLRPHLSADAERAITRHLLIGATAVGVAGLIIVMAANAILDVLDITDETWRLAAGVVCALVAARAIVLPRLGKMPAADGIGFIPIAFPLLLTPQLVVLAVLFGATEATATAWGWLAIGVAAGATVGRMQHRRPEIWLALARMMAMILMVVGIALVIAGIRDV